VVKQCVCELQSMRGFYKRVEVHAWKQESRSWNRKKKKKQVSLLGKFQQMRRKPK